MIFKTRHELRELRKSIQKHNDVMDALRAHFNLMYTMEDFQRFCETLPDVEQIPVSVGEFLHLWDMLTPTVKAIYGVTYRSKKVVIPTPGKEVE